MDPEYYKNMAEWMEGRGKSGATLWVDDESAKHINSDLSFATSERLKLLKVRNISEMYDDALTSSPGRKKTLKTLNLSKDWMQSAVPTQPHDQIFYDS